MRDLGLIALALLLPAPLAAQDLPSDLALLEMTRSRACVPALARLAAVDAEIAPLALRSERIAALDYAISVEDSTRVTPFADADPLETAVRDWFVADAELAEAHVESGDDALLEQRRERRAEVRIRLREALDAANRQAQEIIGAEEGLATAIRDCDDAILIRSAVLEACTEHESPVCEHARAYEHEGPIRFVDDPDDLWDVEHLRPWTDPLPLRLSPDGGLGGARTVALARRGNVTFILGFGPLLRDRTELAPEEVAEFEENLEALGFAFDDPRVVMAPALTIEFDALGRIDGETHYLLHFGDLANPDEDVIWSVPAPESGPFQTIVPADGRVLARLAAGEEVSLTAVQVPEGEDPEAEAVFSLALTSVGQARAVGALLGYMGGGQLAADLATLVPPDPSGPEDAAPAPTDGPGIR